MLHMHPHAQPTHTDFFGHKYSYHYCLTQNVKLGKGIQAYHIVIHKKYYFMNY